MGVYKGMHVLFSEARLYQSGSRRAPVFHGLMALIELPQDGIEGHTIITADRDMAREWAETRWRTLASVPVNVGKEEWNRFAVFSDQPESARLLIGDKFLKELHEAGEAFDHAPLTAVLFRGKNIFLMIPTHQDMFEASPIRTAVSTRKYALAMRREIAGLLEIIDIFDLYKPAPSVKNT